ncbi:hypothetical protein AwDysgo_21790 [Bacteroidales bacterium]|nr:hypothetical protein AwDysgo_21790 [Bacteroidales bacterium]
MENIESQTAKYIYTDSNFEGDGIAFKKDDILYGKLRPYLCKVWLAEFNGSAVGDFFVFRCNLCVTCNYFKYFLLSHNFTDVSNGATYGTKMPRVGWEFLSNLMIFLLPKSEQAAIAAFLDEKCELIEQTIKSRKKQIELFKQEKQTIIGEAATRGVDKNLSLKPSGVEWLGDIPEHWVVWKISRAFRLIGSGTTPRSGLPEYYENGTEAWINTGDLNDNNLYDLFSKNNSQSTARPLNTCAGSG